MDVLVDAYPIPVFMTETLVIFPSLIFAFNLAPDPSPVTTKSGSE